MRLPCRLLLFTLSMLALPAGAQTAIHRCIGSHGNPIFTDQPCATMQASPVRASPTPGGALLAAPPMLCAASRDDLRQFCLTVARNAGHTHDFPPMNIKRDIF